jgi:hypothetical protein
MNAMIDILFLLTIEITMSCNMYLLFCVTINNLHMDHKIQMDFRIVNFQDISIFGNAFMCVGACGFKIFFSIF